ncbi:hypothetical protein FRC11_012241 [Ceratobasidium sp. 423]|nr:hypothetical protein FRC11_012241 [Ceratobasidium sp. 423]
MAQNYSRDHAPSSGSNIIEPEIVPAVASVPADVTPGLGMVELAAAEMNDDSKQKRGANRKHPWYKTPSVWWLLPITAVGAMFRATTVAPRTELFIKFACDELRPEYRVDANLARWDSTPNGTQVDVPLTFIQSNPILNDRFIKPMLLRPDKRCSQDPVVQRAAAKLVAATKSAQGILSCLTLGWWAQYSDRAGRTRVLGLSSVAVLFGDALLFLVAFKPEMVPGGYRILILGEAIRGLFGGSVAIVAAGHAYIADCSSPLARSRIFSFWTGCLYVGVALGPSLGSFINYYSNDLLSTFYISTVIHIIYVILLIFIVPESVSDEARAKARELYEADMKRHAQTTLGSLWRLTSFVRPLSLFIPKRLPTGRRGWRSRDWNLALVGVAAAIVAINVGSYDFKFQYALKTFHWDSVQLGYWLSLVGFWRALYLSVILPVILKALYAREERLSGGTHNDDEKEAQVKRVDLLIVRASLLIDLVGYIMVGIVTSQTPFIGATIILAFGGGFAPSIQSLSLALANPSVHIARREARAHGTSIPSNAKQEIGRLFGALGVIQSLGSQVVGPILFGATYGATIGIYPRAFFWLSTFITLSALAALGAVCLGKETTAETSECEPLLA